MGVRVCVHSSVCAREYCYCYYCFRFLFPYSIHAYTVRIHYHFMLIFGSVVVIVFVRCLRLPFSLPHSLALILSVSSSPLLFTFDSLLSMCCIYSQYISFKYGCICDPKTTADVFPIQTTLHAMRCHAMPCNAISAIALTCDFEYAILKHLNRGKTITVNCMQVACK